MRNEPLIGNGLAVETDPNQMSPEVQMSYSRLKQLKHHENLAQTIKQSGLEYTNQTAKLEIPDILAKKVPLHWNQLLEESNEQLS